MANTGRGGKDSTISVAAERSGPLRTALLALAVAALTFSLFSPCLRYGFVNLDDAQYVHHNPRVIAGFTLEGFRAAFRVFNGEYWLPVLFLSFMADAQMFGTAAWGYHLVNVLLHAANAALLFLLLRGTTRRLWPSLVVSLLFALHPLRVESVVWVSQRKDVLSTFFVLLALASWFRFTAASESGVRRSWYVLTFLLLLLGLMTKPMLVTFPLLLLVLDWWPLGRCAFPWHGFAGWWRKNRRLVWEKAPFLVLGVGFSASTLFNQRVHVVSAGGGQALLDPLLRAPLSYFIYLGKMVLPLGLGLEFRHPHPVLPVAQGLAAVLAHATILWFLLRARQKRPYLLAGWLWYLISLLPVSGLIPVGLQWTSDRFTYVPAMGLAVACVWWAWDEARGRIRSSGVVIAVAGLLAVLGTVTLIQMRYWKNSTILFQRSVHVDPGSPRAYFVFGSALARGGRLEEALGVMEEAVRRGPGDPIVLTGLVDVLADLGKLEEAIALLQEAAASRPDSVSIHRDLAKYQGVQGDWEGRSRSLTSLFNLVRTKREKSVVGDELAKTLWVLGRKEEALLRFREAVQLRPSWSVARFDLSLALLRLGMADEAIVQFDALSSLRPIDPLAVLGLAESLLAAGRTTEARSRLDSLAGRGIGPESAFARGRLAELEGRIREADELYRRALDANPGPDLMRLMRFGMGARFEERAKE